MPKVDKSRNVYERVRTVQPKPGTFIRIGVKKTAGPEGGKTVALAPHSYKPAEKKGVSPVQRTKRR